MKTEFNKTLKEGQVLEEAVRKRLRVLLPPCYEVTVTDQRKDSLDRYIYSLCDVRVTKGDHTVLGIECKLGKTKYEACLNRNGWDGDYNTPLNASSLRTYKEANFPFYIVNINQFCHKAFAARLDKVLKSPNDAGKNVKVSGEVIYNIDSRDWMTWEGDFNLTDILMRIIGRELL